MSLSEMVVVLVVAILALGPRRLPEIARHAGRLMGDFRRAAADLRTTIDTAIAETPVMDLPDDTEETPSGVSGSSPQQQNTRTGDTTHILPAAKEHTQVRAFTLTPAQDAEPVPAGNSSHLPAATVDGTLPAAMPMPLQVATPSEAHSHGATSVDALDDLASRGQNAIGERSV